MSQINGSKQYTVTYNVVANAGPAAAEFQKLANVVQTITKNGAGMAKFNQQVRDIVRNTERLNTALSSFSPRLDMRTFNSQLKVMEQAVAGAASNMQNMINAALSGNKTALKRAIAKRGGWAEAVREGLVASNKEAERQIKKYRKELDERITARNNPNKLYNGVPLDAKKNNARIKFLTQQLGSLENSISATSGALSVLRKESSSATLKGLTVPANMAQGAKDLQGMAESINKWNRAVGRLNQKSVTLKINARDNASGVINQVKTKLEELQGMAANLFIGGSQAAKPKAGQTRTQSVKRPAGVMSQKDLKDLGTLKDNITKLATTRANGMWSKGLAEQYAQLAPMAAQITGLPENTDINSMMRAVRAVHKSETEKYNNWRSSLAKAPKAKASTASVTPTGAIPAMSQVDNLINTAKTLQGIADKNGVRVSTRLNRTGILARGISGYETMQKLADTHPIIMRGVFNGSEAGFGLNQSIINLQQLANSRPVIIRGVFNGSGAGFGLNQSIGNLQKLTEGRPVAVSSTAKLKGIVSGQKVNEQLNEQLKPLNLQLNTEAARAKFQEFIKYVQSNNKVKVTLMTDAKGGKGGRGGGGGAVPPVVPIGGATSGGGVAGTTRNPIVVRSERGGGPMKRWSYPLTGNTSFGARTPAAVEMMKGMGVMMAIGGAMQGVGNAFSGAVDYQNTMTTAKAILKNSYKGSNFDEDFAEMERIVRRQGVETKFTAPEVAGGAKYLAMSGMDIKKINKAIKPVVDIALAGDIDLPTAADKMTNIMVAFGMKSAEDFAKTADVLTNTFTRSNTNMLQLAEAAKYAAPVAATRGLPFEDMMALVGVMSDAGIQDSMAGTTLRMMMNNIYKPSTAQEKEWARLEKLGVRRTDANGRWLGVIEILDQIAKVVPQDGKAGETLADVMGKLFRVTSVAGASQLAKNIGKVKELRESNKNARGNADMIRQERISNIQGRWAQVVSTFQEDILKLFEAPAFQEKLIKMLEKFRNILAKPETLKSLEAVMDLLLFFGETMGSMAKTALKMYNTMPGLIKWMLKFQIFMTAIGSYIIAPFIQLANIFNMAWKPIAGLMGLATTGRLAAAGGAAGGLATAAGAAAATGAARRIGVARGIGAASNLVGAALVGGSIKGGRFAQAYAERAARYRMAAATQQNMINAMMTGMTMGQFANDETRKGLWGRPGTNMNNLQELRAGKAKYNAMATQYGLLAMQATMINRARKSKQIGNATLITRAARQGRLSWGNFGRASGAAFSAGMTAWSFGSVLNSVKGGLTSVVLGLSKALGMLASPVGLATVAIGGLAAAAVYTTKRINRGRQEGVEAAEKIKKTIGAEREKPRFGYGFNNDTSKNIADLTSTDRHKYGATRINGYLNPQMQHYIGLGSIYDDIDQYGTSKWGEQLYETLITPYQKYIFNKKQIDTFGYNGEMTLQGFRAIASSADRRGGMDKDTVRKYAQRAAIYQVVEKHPEYIKAQKEIVSLYDSWAKLPDSEKASKRGELMEQIRAVQNRFTNMNGANIEGKDLRNMRIFEIFNSQQGQMAAFNLLRDFMYDDNSAFRLNYHSENVKNATVLSESWIDSMQSILSNVSFTVKQGEKQATLVAKFNGMTLDFADLTEKMNKLHMDFGSSVQDHLNVITSIVMNMMDMPGLKEVINSFGGVQQLINFLLQQTAAYKAWAAQNGIKTIIDKNYDKATAGKNIQMFDPKTGKMNSYFGELRKEEDRIDKKYEQDKGFNTYLRRPEGNVVNDMPKIINQDAYKNPYDKNGKSNQSGAFGLNVGGVTINLNGDTSYNARDNGDKIAESLVGALSMMVEQYNGNNVS